METAVDARGQLERVFVLWPRSRLDGQLYAFSFGNLRSIDRLENAVLEDCLDRPREFGGPSAGPPLKVARRGSRRAKRQRDASIPFSSTITVAGAFHAGSRGASLHPRVRSGDFSRRELRVERAIPELNRLIRSGDGGPMRVIVVVLGFWYFPMKKAARVTRKPGKARAGVSAPGASTVWLMGQSP